MTRARSGRPTAVGRRRSTADRDGAGPPGRRRRPPPGGRRRSRSRAARRPACSSSAGWRRSSASGAIVVASCRRRDAGARSCSSPGSSCSSIGLVAGAGLAGHRAAGARRRCLPRARRRSSSSRPSIPVSLLASSLLGIPLGARRHRRRRPARPARRRSRSRRSIYLGLIRLLVVETGRPDRGPRWASGGSDRAAARRPRAGGALCAVPVIVVTLPIAAILVAIFAGHAGRARCRRPGSRRASSLNLIAGAIVAPIGEELLFRGFATTAWVRAPGPGAGRSSAAPCSSPSSTS